MNKTRKIILMLDSSRAVDRGIIRGIVEYSRLRGDWSFYRFKPLFQTYPFSPKHTDNILQRLNKLDADGLVGYLPAEQKLQKNIVQRRFPAIIVPITTLIKGVVNIQQGTQVGIVGAEYLLNLGFKHFAFCGTKDRWSNIRQENFKQRIEQAGFDVRTYPLTREHKKHELELNRLARWLTQLPHPIGIMTCNDERSSDLVKACHIAELKIPDQVAILGVDNDEMICNLSSPPLSSIKLNSEAIGYKSAEMMDHLISGEAIAENNLFFEPTGIVTRQSTDILTFEDQQVAKAIRFIRNNARRDIHVDDVVDQSCLSIRALQQRFRSAIGRGISQEIRRIRIQQMAEMLISTNLNINQIAYDLSFRDINHISRIFRKEMGMTPIEYRKSLAHDYR